MTVTRQRNAALMISALLLLAQLFAVIHHHPLSDTGQSDVCLLCVFQGESGSALVSVPEVMPTPLYSLIWLFMPVAVASLRPVFLRPSARGPPPVIF